MSYRGLRKQYNNDEIVTPLALVYNRDGEIVALRCLRSVEVCYIMKYCTSDELINLLYNEKQTKINVVTADIPISLLDRYFFYEKHQKGIIINRCNKLGKVYEDGEIIEDYLQLCVLLDNSAKLTSSAYEPLTGLEPVYLLVNSKDSFGVIMTHSKMKEFATPRAESFGNVNVADIQDGYFPLTSNKLVIPYEKISDYALSAGVTTVVYPLVGNTVQIPDSIFDAPVTIIEDCSYGNINLVVQDKPLVQQIVWKGIYTSEFRARLSNLPLLKSFTLPIAYRLSLEGISGTTLNMGFTPGKTNIGEPSMQVTLRNCNNITINLADNPAILKEVYIDRNVHISKITGKGTIGITQLSGAPIIIDDFDPEITILYYTGYATSKADMPHSYIHGSGSFKTMSPFTNADVDIQGSFVTSYSYGNVTIDAVNIINASDCILGHNVTLANMKLPDPTQIKPCLSTTWGTAEVGIRDCQGDTSAFLDSLCSSCNSHVKLTVLSLTAPSGDIPVPVTVKSLLLDNISKHKSKIKLSADLSNIVVYCHCQDDIEQFVDIMLSAYNNNLCLKTEVQITPTIDDNNAILDFYTPISRLLSSEFRACLSRWVFDATSCASSRLGTCYAMTMPPIKGSTYLLSDLIFFPDADTLPELSLSANAQRAANFDDAQWNKPTSLFCGNPVYTQVLSKQIKDCISQKFKEEPYQTALESQKVIYSFLANKKLVNTKQPISCQQFLAYAQKHKSEIINRRS